MRNPKFNALLDRMREIHERKNADYASDQDPYSNFTFAGELAKGFTDPKDIAFATLIGVKIARLIELKGKGKAAQNESVQDTFLDLATYAALWASCNLEVPSQAGSSVCGSKGPKGFICTEYPGHEGPHEARGLSDPTEPYDTWG